MVFPIRKHRDFIRSHRAGHTEEVFEVSGRSTGIESARVGACVCRGYRGRNEKRERDERRRGVMKERREAEKRREERREKKID